MFFFFFVVTFLSWTISRIKAPACRQHCKNTIVFTCSIYNNYLYTLLIRRLPFNKNHKNCILEAFHLGRILHEKRRYRVYLKKEKTKKCCDFHELDANHPFPHYGW